MLTFMTRSLPVSLPGQPARSNICCHAFREGCRVLVLEHVEVPSAARSAFISHSYESLGLSSVEHPSLNMWGSLSSFPASWSTLRMEG